MASMRRAFTAQNTIPCLVILAVFVLVVVRPCIPGAADGRSYSLVLTQVPYKSAEGSFLLDTAAGQGGRIVTLSPGGSLRVLTSEFAAAADPSVSFDAQHILFAGKRAPEDRWNIWEMDVDGRNKRQITNNFGDCREPEYLARSSITPPDFNDKVRWITFTSNAAGAYQEGDATLAQSLYAATLEPVSGRGMVTWRLTFNLSSDFSPLVLSDGRTLFTSRQKAAGNLGRYPLLAMNWDGTGLNLFCGNGEGELLKTMACEMPDRTLVFVESDNPNGRGGQLARVSFKRPLHSYKALTRGSGQYLYPHVTPDGKLLVSYSDGAGSYGLYVFDPEQESIVDKIFLDPAWETLDAQPIVPRPEPMGRISAVVDTLKWGHLHCLSVYESDRPDVRSIRRGSVKKVRFLEGVPASAAGQSPGPARPHEAVTKLLGDAPVEEDGSFFVEVPGDTPFIMQLLDGNGTVLETMHRWLWVRRGTSRGCIGCHENKELAPENKVSDAVRKAEPYILQAK